METWKDIKGFEGLYQISNHGNVRSFHRGCNLLTPKKNNCGYLWVELADKGRIKRLLIHRLVALHFIENPLQYPIINHKDECPMNNHVNNLEWCSHSYNTTYSLKRSGRRNYEGSYKKNKYGKRKRKHDIRKIVQYDNDLNVIKVWNSFVDIKYTLLVNESSIRDCCNGKRKTAYGFKWAYVHSDKPQENVV